MKKFDSTYLRTILAITMVITLGGFVGGFYYAQDQLITFAKEVSQTSAELDKKDTNQAQTGLSSTLATLKPSVDKAASFIATTDTYLNAASRDINKYGASTGVEISEISPTQLTATPGGISATGIQSSYVRVVLKSPVDFVGLVKFIKAIETNLPKMKLKGINLSRTADPNKVAVEPLIVEVYTK